MQAIELPVQRNGLLVEARVGICSPMRTAMWRRSLPQPPAVDVTLIVDTGADTTMLDEQTMRSLQLQPTSKRLVLTSSSAGVPEECDVYDVRLELLGKGGKVWAIDPIQVMARPLINQSMQGMIGRDILDRAVLQYDGPRATFKLIYA